MSTPFEFREKDMLRQRGFSLIELLVVISVIAILSGIFFGAGAFLFKSMNTKDAKAQIAVLRTALEDYYREEGEFPLTDEQSLSERSAILLNVLSGTHDVNNEPLTDSIRSFIPRDKLLIKQTEGISYLIDPWDNPIVFEYPRLDLHDGFLLFSMGPDGKSSIFSEPQDSTPDKQGIDHDNIPVSEPGKW